MDLESLRAEMDAVNEELLDLLLRRMDVATRIGVYKRERGLPVHMPEREAKTIAWAREQAGEDMADYAEEFFTLLMDLAKRAEV